MKYIAFKDTCAGFALIRLNNVLFANSSLLRTELINAHTLEFNGVLTNRDEAVVKQVMSMYDCHLTDEIPASYEPFNPQPPPVSSRRAKKKEWPIGVPTQYFREARS